MTIKIRESCSSSPLSPITALLLETPPLSPALSSKEKELMSKSFLTSLPCRNQWRLWQLLEPYISLFSPYFTSEENCSEAVCNALSTLITTPRSWHTGVRHHKETTWTELSPGQFFELITNSIHSAQKNSADIEQIRLKGKTLFHLIPWKEVADKLHPLFDLLPPEASTLLVELEKQWPHAASLYPEQNSDSPPSQQKVDLDFALTCFSPDSYLLYRIPTYLLSSLHEKAPAVPYEELTTHAFSHRTLLPGPTSSILLLEWGRSIPTPIWVDTRLTIYHTPTKHSQENETVFIRDALEILFTPSLTALPRLQSAQASIPESLLHFLCGVIDCTTPEKINDRGLFRLIKDQLQGQVLLRPQVALVFWQKALAPLLSSSSDDISIASKLDEVIAYCAKRWPHNSHAATAALFQLYQSFRAISHLLPENSVRGIYHNYFYQEARWRKLVSYRTDSDSTLPFIAHYLANHGTALSTITHLVSLAGALQLLHQTEGCFTASFTGEKLNIEWQQDEFMLVCVFQGWHHLKELIAFSAIDDDLLDFYLLVQSSPSSYLRDDYKLIDSWKELSCQVEEFLAICPELLDRSHPLFQLIALEWLLIATLLEETSSSHQMIYPFLKKALLSLSTYSHLRYPKLTHYLHHLITRWLHAFPQKNLSFSLFAGLAKLAIKWDEYGHTKIAYSLFQSLANTPFYCLLQLSSTEKRSVELFLFKSFQELIARKQFEEAEKYIEALCSPSFLSENYARKRNELYAVRGLWNKWQEGLIEGVKTYNHIEKWLLPWQRIFAHKSDSDKLVMHSVLMRVMQRLLTDSSLSSTRYAESSLRLWMEIAPKIWYSELIEEWSLYYPLLFNRYKELFPALFLTALSSSLFPSFLALFPLWTTLWKAQDPAFIEENEKLLLQRAADPQIYYCLIQWSAHSTYPLSPSAIYNLISALTTLKELNKSSFPISSVLSLLQFLYKNLPEEECYHLLFSLLLSSYPCKDLFIVEDPHHHHELMTIVLRAARYAIERAQTTSLSCWSQHTEQWRLYIKANVTGEQRQRLFSSLPSQQTVLETQLQTLCSKNSYAEAASLYLSQNETMQTALLGSSSYRQLIQAICSQPSLYDYPLLTLPWNQEGFFLLLAHSQFSTALRWTRVAQLIEKKRFLTILLDRAFSALSIEEFYRWWHTEWPDNEVASFSIEQLHTLSEFVAHSIACRVEIPLEKWLAALHYSNLALLDKKEEKTSLRIALRSLLYALAVSKTDLHQERYHFLLDSTSLQSEKEILEEFSRLRCHPELSSILLNFSPWIKKNFPSSYQCQLISTLSYPFPLELLSSYEQLSTQFDWWNYQARAILKEAPYSFAPFLQHYARSGYTQQVFQIWSDVEGVLPLQAELPLIDAHAPDYVSLIPVEGNSLSSTRFYTFILKKLSLYCENGKREPKLMELRLYWGKQAYHDERVALLICKEKSHWPILHAFLIALCKDENSESWQLAKQWWEKIVSLHHAAPFLFALHVGSSSDPQPPSYQEIDGSLALHLMFQNLLHEAAPYLLFSDIAYLIDSVPNPFSFPSKLLHTFFIKLGAHPDGNALFERIRKQAPLLLFHLPFASLPHLFQTMREENHWYVVERMEKELMLPYYHQEMRLHVILLLLESHYLPLLHSNNSLPSTSAIKGLERLLKEKRLLEAFSSLPSNKRLVHLKKWLEAIARYLIHPHLLRITDEQYLRCYPWLTEREFSERAVYIAIRDMIAPPLANSKELRAAMNYSLPLIVDFLGPLLDSIATQQGKQLCYRLMSLWFTLQERLHGANPLLFLLATWTMNRLHALSPSKEETKELLVTHQRYFLIFNDFIRVEEEATNTEEYKFLSENQHNFLQAATIWLLSLHPLSNSLLSQYHQLLLIARMPPWDDLLPSIESNPQAYSRLIIATYTNLFPFCSQLRHRQQLFNFLCDEAMNLIRGDEKRAGIFTSSSAKSLSKQQVVECCKPFLSFFQEQLSALLSEPSHPFSLWIGNAHTDLKPTTNLIEKGIVIYEKLFRITFLRLSAKQREELFSSTDLFLKKVISSPSLPLTSKLFRLQAACKIIKTLTELVTRSATDLSIQEQGAELKLFLLDAAKSTLEQLTAAAALALQDKQTAFHPLYFSALQHSYQAIRTFHSLLSPHDKAIPQHKLKKAQQAYSLLLSYFNRVNEQLKQLLVKRQNAVKK